MEFIKRIQRTATHKKTRLVFVFSISILAILAIIWAFVDLPKNIEKLDTAELSASLQEFKDVASIDSFKSPDDSSLEQEKNRNFLQVEDKPIQTLTANTEEKIADRTKQEIKQSVIKDNIAIGVNSAYNKDGKTAFLLEIINAGENPVDYKPIIVRMKFEDKEYQAEMNQEISTETISIGELKGFEIVFPILIESGEIELEFPDVPSKEDQKENFLFSFKLDLPK